MAMALIPYACAIKRLEYHASKPVDSAVVAVRNFSLEVNKLEHVYYISQAWSTLEQGCFAPDV
jgi:hypothetical protein